MGVAKQNLSANDSAELLSYIINVTPALREEIQLPKQGKSIKPIGKLIMGNPVYKNAFLNTINIIGKTVITRNHWENPWRRFTYKGSLSYGQQVRDIIVDIANVYDYNAFAERPHDMLKTEVPNVLSTIYEVNYQKFYKTTTSDEQMAMAFETEDLFSLIDEIVNSLYEGMEYDDYQVAKYILARRILDGTITAVQIENFENMSDRDVVAFVKGYSNDMLFRSPNFNPAGIRKATKFDEQFAIVTTKFDGKFTTNVLATSYFRDDANMKANLELVDGFGNFDEVRLAEIFAKRDENGDVVANEYLDGYVPLTDTEKAALAEIPVAIVSEDFFQNRKFGTDTMAAGRKTEFFNPQTMRTNHWLHEWGIMATSPFANAIVFTQTAQGVTAVVVSPSTATISKGQALLLKSAVATTGFANKAVAWSIDSAARTKGAKINELGELTVPATYESTGDGTAAVHDIEITTILETGDVVEVNGLKYTVDATTQDTIAKQITALKAVLNTAAITDDFTIGGSSPHCTLTEKSGKYGQIATPVVTLTKASGSSGAISYSTTTDGVLPGNIIIITATSVYDKTKSGIATITVA